MTHSYENPSKRQDTSAVELGLSDGEMLDKNGFSIRKPISDRECIYKALDNSRQLAGMDRKQVARLCDEIMAPPKVFPNRLCKEFAVEKTDEEIQNEYPPL